MGCVRTNRFVRGAPGRRGRPHSRVDTAGTVAKIDLRLPYPSGVRPPLLRSAGPGTSAKFSPFLSLRSLPSGQTMPAQFIFLRK